MADTAVVELETLLGGLGLETPIPKIPTADVLAKPVDVYRSYLASLLAEPLGSDPCTVYEAIHSTTGDIALSDLAVILPRLKLSEDDIKSLPLELKHKVMHTCQPTPPQTRLPKTDPVIHTYDPPYSEPASRQPATLPLPPSPPLPANSSVLSVSYIVAQLPSSPLFPAPFVDGVHLRFLFATKTLPRLLLPYINSRGATYGNEPALGLRDAGAAGEGSRKKVVVEFSSPNVACAFGETNLRSTFLGAFISKQHEAMGWDVVRLNYLGDWGMNIGLLAVGWERYGSDDELKANPVQHLQEVYSKIVIDFEPEEKARDEARKNGLSTVEIETQGIFAGRSAFFKKMEDGDEAALALWKQFLNITVADLSADYARLGIKFDEYAGESHVKPETMAEVEAALKEKGVLDESEDSSSIDFAKHSGRKGLGVSVVRRRNGATTYLLRDIAAALDRERAYGFDKMIYVVAARQEAHFQQVFAALELMGRADLCQKLEHVSFGPKIQGMADHLKGTHLLGDILDRTAALMRTVAEDENGDDAAMAAAQVAAINDCTVVSALLVQDMSGRRGHNSSFDPKRMMSLDAETGVRLQLWHANLGNAIAGTTTDEIVAAEPEYCALEREGSIDLLRLLAQYPDVTAAAYRSLEPHSILAYLFKLVHIASAWISEDEGEQEADYEAAENGESSAAAAARAERPVAGEMKARLMLYQSAHQVLENGMRLLSIPIVAH